MKRFQNAYKNETALIIGNGPSLREIPVDFLKKYQSFGTNRIYLLHGFRPDFYVAINALVIEQSMAHILALNSIKFIKERYAKELNAYPLRSISGQGFSRNIVRGIHEGWTVTYTCMQIAFYAGFRTVLLVGVDHKYKQAGRPNQTIVAEAPDPNHFDPNYFGPGTAWQCADLERSRQAYILARDEFAGDGRKIINLTPGTALDVFPKDDWRAYA